MLIFNNIAIFLSSDLHLLLLPFYLLFLWLDKLPLFFRLLYQYFHLLLIGLILDFIEIDFGLDTLDICL